MNKKEERAKALKERMNEDVKSSSLVVLKELESLNILDKYNNIGIYYPIGKEINIMPIMDIYPNKNFYLPKTEDEIVAGNPKSQPSAILFPSSPKG